MSTSARRPRQSKPSRAKSLPKPIVQASKNTLWRWATLAISATLLVVIGWWALGRGSSANPNQATTSSQPITGNSRVVAPDFTLSLLGSGQPFHLAAQPGKATLLMFTASWCGDCIPEIPKLAELYREKAALGLNVLVIDLDPSETDADFLGFKARAGGADHYWARDTDGRVTISYNVRATDTKVMLDRNRGIVATTVGAVNLDTLRRYADEALK